MDPNIWRRRSNGEYVRRSEADIAARTAKATAPVSPRPLRDDPLVSAAFSKYGTRSVEVPSAEEENASALPLGRGPAAHRASVYRSRSGQYVNVNSDSGARLRGPRGSPCGRDLGRVGYGGI